MVEFYANPNKKVEIELGGKKYLRHAVKTHFVTPGESYIELFKNYVKPIYEEGDIVSVSEKVISMCQNRICYAKDIKIGFFARFLSKFVRVTPAGEAVGNPYKMQLAINLAGLPRVIFAAICAGVGRLFKRKGIFYKIVDNGISGIDGFCRDAFDYYVDKGIFLPDDPCRVCDEIKAELGISCMVVDANDLGVEILGKSSDINLGFEELRALIKDNPAGQGGQQTPIILIRAAEKMEMKAIEKNCGDENLEDGMNIVGSELRVALTAIKS